MHQVWSKNGQDRVQRGRDRQVEEGGYRGITGFQGQIGRKMCKYVACSTALSLGIVRGVLYGLTLDRGRRRQRSLVDSPSIVMPLGRGVARPYARGRFRATKGR